MLFQGAAGSQPGWGSQTGRGLPAAQSTSSGARWEPRAPAETFIFSVSCDSPLINVCPGAFLQLQAAFFIFFKTALLIGGGAEGKTLKQKQMLTQFLSSPPSSQWESTRPWGTVSLNIDGIGCLPHLRLALLAPPTISMDSSLECEVG